MPDQSQQQHLEQTQDLHQIQEQVKKMDVKLNAIDDKVGQMLFQLGGNELDRETGGLIKRVNNLEKRVDTEVERLENRIMSLEKFRDRIMVIVVVFAALGGFGVSELVKIFAK